MDQETLKRRYSPEKVMVIDGVAYNVTTFADSHPGGAEILDEYLYKDATDAFNEIGHSARARKLLEKFVVKSDGKDIDTKSVSTHTSSNTSTFTPASIPTSDPMIDLERAKGSSGTLSVPDSRKSSPNVDASKFKLRYALGLVMLSFWTLVSYMSRSPYVATLFTGLGAFIYNMRSRVLNYIGFTGSNNSSPASTTSSRQVTITKSTDTSSVSVVGTQEAERTSLRVRAQVDKVIHEAGDSYRVTLALPPSIDTENHLKPGRHIKIIHPDRVTIKSYTPVWHNKNILQLVIKRYNPTDSEPMRGKMSRFITESTYGDYIELEIPTGKVWLDDVESMSKDSVQNETSNIPPTYQLTSRGSTIRFKKILALCGGTGLTPIYSIIQSILTHCNTHGDADKNKGVKIALFNSNRSFDDIILHNELTELTVNEDKLRILHVVTKDHDSASHCGIDTPSRFIEVGHHTERYDGYINKQFIDRMILPVYCDQVSDTVCLVCGPKPFVETMKECLGDVFKDRFVVL